MTSFPNARWIRALTAQVRYARARGPPNATAFFCDLGRGLGEIPVLVTCGHVGQGEDVAYFEPGRLGDRPHPALAVPCDSSRWLHHPTEDLAVVPLTRSEVRTWGRDGWAHVPWLTIGAGPPRPGTTVVVAGFPDGLTAYGSGLATLRAGRVLPPHAGSGPGEFEVWASVAPGSSGSPVLWLSGDDWHLAGILNSGPRAAAHGHAPEGEDDPLPATCVSASNLEWFRQVLALHQA